MNFSIRAILVFITFAALACCFWPDGNRAPSEAHLLFCALATCHAVTFFLISAARQQTQERASRSASSMAGQSLMLWLTLMGIIPFSALWLFGFVEPHEHRQTWWSDMLVTGSWWVAVYSYVPGAICLLISFWVAAGAARNVPLLVVRWIWAMMFVAVPIWVYFFIFPRLG